MFLWRPVCTIVFGSLFSGLFMPRLGYYMSWYVMENTLSVVNAAYMGKY